KKVWFLLRDPNPLVAGRGKAILEGAGIEVECLEDHPHPVAQMLVRAARRIHQAFLITMEQKRPIFYWIKWASSLDGFMAWQPGRSAFNAITSPSTRALAREMRGLCDGIMTTRSTILVDNPLMDLRDTEFVSKSYPLFIWDEGAQLLNYPELRIFSQRQAGPIILLDASGVNGLRPEVSSMVSQNPRGLAEPPIYVWKVSKNRQEAWQMWEERASQMGIQSIWLEGGPRFTSSLLKEGRWDYASAFFGNIIIGANGKGRWYEGLVVDGQLEKSVELDHDLVVSLERDFLVTFSNHFKRFT
ncbi:MAG: dihydrofolate reductase family protein, partial [Pseudobdellovibrionaceae bacterium]|nr:dihydrofolate reductase family protein [Pseudobdellovibrionaceae bacterium]